MASLLKVLCVLSALTATGLSLICKQCKSSDYKSCFGDTVTCPPDSACGTIYTYEGFAFSTFFTTCVPKNRCDLMGSASITDSKMKKSISCCYTDQCTPPKPTLPADNLQTNGVNCTTCKGGTFSTWCNSEDTLKCTGNENHCLLMTDAMGARRGCATDSICSIGTELDSAGLTTKYVCGATNGDTSATSSGSFGLHSIPFFSFIVAFAAAKIVYF
ncbi:phospholipase A2 inhibitor and Ly6/PLAUR domain-containing protein-like [Mixophyes fleayi]|uniref:phospholipase A2 inhibitor and Ly6/PLAUR domain-containing protein-like n=1 Tax=Mixophyes fleayi TaxID=3061075 RepID=UPI003F4E10C4